LTTTTQENNGKSLEAQPVICSIRFEQQRHERTLLQMNLTSLLSKNQHAILPPTECILRTETIICPGCGIFQVADVTWTIGDPWLTLIHQCRNCDHVILESEWANGNGTLRPVPGTTSLATVESYSDFERWERGRCAECDGHGQIMFCSSEYPCRACGGTGKTGAGTLNLFEAQEGGTK
jgi:hypothetical protein